MLGRAIILAATVAGLGDLPAARAANPDPGERAEALLQGAAINRFVARQLPATFAVRGDRAAGIGAEDVVLVDARYCSGNGKNRGRIVGVLRPAADEVPGLPPIDAHDCQGKLDSVARRLAGGPGAGKVAVAELALEWAPWELRVSIGEIAPAGDGARPLARTLARAKAAGPLAVVDTSGLQLATERGSTLGLDLALSFPKDGVLATLTPACAGCVPPPRAPIVSAGAASADADASVAATLRFANRMVAFYSDEGPLVLDVERQSIEIRNIQIAGGEGTLSVSGRATSRAVSETALVHIESAGPDLKLAQVRAEAEMENCGGQGGVADTRCNIRNATRGPAAAALAAALTSRYRGQALRTFIAPPPFSFDVGGRRMTLRLVPTRASSTGGSLIVHGKADVE
jgi:hypothetical protein